MKPAAPVPRPDHATAAGASARLRPTALRRLLPLGCALALAAIPQSGIADEPLTLEAAVREALAKNYTIRIESYSVPIAGAGVLAAHGRYDPRLAFTFSTVNDEQPARRASETGEELPPTVFKQHAHDAALEGELPLGLLYRLSARTRNDRTTYNAFDDDFTSFAGVSAQLPLLRGLGGATTRHAIRLARTDRSLSEWEFRAALINTITHVAYAYHELLFAEANLHIAHRLRDNAASLHRENQERFRVGAMSDYDVLSAQARVAGHEQGILLARRAVNDAANRLRQLISDDTSPALLARTITLPAMPAPREVRVDPAADIPGALAARPDYQQARLAVLRQELDHRLYRNQLLPAVDVFGSYGYNGRADTFGASRGVISDREHPSYTAGVSVSVPIVSAAERGRLRAARLSHERAGMALRRLEQDIVVHVGNAADQIAITWQRVLATRTSRELSERTLSAELKRLRAGPGNTFFVLQVQEILAGDEVREARALADYRNALAEYDRQLGRTLATYHVEVEEHLTRQRHCDSGAVEVTR